jgi:hypothetical protein
LLVLFATAGCHLCDDAEAILRYCHSYYPQVQWRTVDIAEEPALVERYGVRIPVISMADSEAELNWPFDPGQLMAFIKSQTNGGH